MHRGITSFMAILVASETSFFTEMDEHMKILSRWISIISRYSQIHYTRKFEHLGLGGGQYIFLLFICENAGTNQDHLAEQLTMNKSTVARVVASLEESGFVYRQVDVDDKRAYNLHPTDKGKAVYQDIVDVLDEWNVALTDGLTPQEQEMTESLLIKIMQNAVKFAKQDEEN